MRTDAHWSFAPAGRLPRTLLCARMLLIIALVVLPGCVTTNTFVSLEYVVPQKYGDGRVSITSTIVK